MVSLVGILRLLGELVLRQLRSRKVPNGPNNGRLDKTGYPNGDKFN